MCLIFCYICTNNIYYTQKNKFRKGKSEKTFVFVIIISVLVCKWNYSVSKIKGTAAKNILIELNSDMDMFFLLENGS